MTDYLMSTLQSNEVIFIQGFFENYDRFLQDEPLSIHWT